MFLVLPPYLYAFISLRVYLQAGSVPSRPWKAWLRLALFFFVFYTGSPCAQCWLYNFDSTALHFIVVCSWLPILLCHSFLSSITCASVLCPPFKIPFRFSAACFQAGHNLITSFSKKNVWWVMPGIPEGKHCGSRCHHSTLLDFVSGVLVLPSPPGLHCFICVIPCVGTCLVGPPASLCHRRLSM